MKIFLKEKIFFALYYVIFLRYIILYTISYVIKIYLMTILYLIILQLKFYSNNNIDIETNIGINIDILIVKT